MLRRITSGLLKNFPRYYPLKNVARTNPTRCYISKGSKVILGSQICTAAMTSEERTAINLEDELGKACEEGDVAIIFLMNKLKDFVVVVCREYRTCLIKQIEITEMASQIGPLSEVWDELPQYRTLANELTKELNDYMIVFNTIGQMTSDDTLVSFVTGSTDQLNLITEKYQELDVVLQKEFQQNKELELQLLRINYDSILKDVQ